jgi:hypothetical protein
MRARTRHHEAPRGHQIERRRLKVFERPSFIDRAGQGDVRQQVDL